MWGAEVYKGEEKGGRGRRAAHEQSQKKRENEGCVEARGASLSLPAEDRRIRVAGPAPGKTDTQGEQNILPHPNHLHQTPNQVLTILPSGIRKYVTSSEHAKHLRGTHSSHAGGGLF